MASDVRNIFADWVSTFFVHLAEGRVADAVESVLEARNSQWINDLDAAERELLQSCKLKVSSRALGDVKEGASAEDYFQVCTVCALCNDLAGCSKVGDLLATAAIQELGKVMASSAKKLKSLHSLASVSRGAGGAVDASDPLPFATCTDGLVQETLRHINALCSTGMPPDTIIPLFKKIAKVGLDSVNLLVTDFLEMRKLIQWTKFSRGDAPPPRRARHADSLVQEVIDPILSEICSVCQACQGMIGFLRDVFSGVCAAKASQQGDDAPSVDAWSQSLAASVQELVGYYVVLEHYSILNNAKKMAKIAEIEPVDGKVCVLSAVEDCFFICSTALNRALLTLNLQAVGPVINVTVEVLSDHFMELLRLICAGGFNEEVGEVYKALEFSGESAAATASAIEEQHGIGKAAATLEDQFSATLDQLLDESSTGASAGDATAAGRAGLGGAGSSLQGAGDSGGRGKAGEQRKVRKESVASKMSLAVAVNSCYVALEKLRSLVEFLQSQFIRNFGERQSPRIEIFLEELENVRLKIEAYADAAAGALVQHDVPGIKDVLREHLLHAEYVVGEVEYDSRRRSDLFVNELMLYLSRPPCTLNHVRVALSNSAMNATLRALATELDKLLERCWLQMNFNALGVMLLQSDVQTVMSRVNTLACDNDTLGAQFQRIQIFSTIISLSKPSELCDASVVRLVMGTSVEKLREVLNLRTEKDFREGIEKALRQWKEMVP